MTVKNLPVNNCGSDQNTLNLKYKRGHDTGKEFASGIDLCELFADTLVKAKTTPSSDVYDQLEQASHEKSRKKPRERKRGASELHFRMANVFWAEKNYEMARNHFILSERPESFAAFLVEMHETMGFSSEADMFVALAVLQLLCLHRVRTASCLLQQYTEIHPSLQATRPPYQKPLLNFLWLLMLTIPKRNVSYFSILVEKYHISIGRDPNYKTYLDKIGQLFFGLQAPSNMSSMGIFGSLIRGMLGNDKKEEEEVFSDSDMDTDSGSNRMEL
uniref:Golgi to ER traffic protein 4 homolog n=1 Tax=Heterorhabditis bacteriophora TaxID=37862 RepID=A0A1I7XGY2_HETBA